MAAKELHVTPAAISHQVKGLEDYFGQRLFRRLKRGLELTRAGQVLLPRLSEGFVRLGDAVAELRSIEEEGTLAVSAAPSFATRWLAPRLHRFVGGNPELDVRINASTRLIDPGKDPTVSGDTVVGSPVEDADIVVRFGTGDYPGFRVDKLLSVAVTPMCSPRLLKSGHAAARAGGPEAPRADPRQRALRRRAVALGRLVRGGRAAGHGYLARPALQPRHAGAGSRGRRHGGHLGMPVLAGTDLASGRLVAPLPLSLPLKFALLHRQRLRHGGARRRRRVPRLAVRGSEKRLGGKTEARGEPAALARREFETAAVRARDAVDDGEAETGAAAAAAASSRRVKGRFSRSSFARAARRDRGPGLRRRRASLRAAS